MAKDGPTEGEVFTGGAYCFSSCTLAFMGGELRLVGNSALGLSRPMNTLTDTDREEFYSYFTEMGVSPDAFDTMMITPPDGRGDILYPQAIALDIIDGAIRDDEEPGSHFCGPNVKENVRCPRKSEAAIVPASVN